MKIQPFKIELNEDEEFYNKLIFIFNMEKSKTTDYLLKASKDPKRGMRNDEFWEDLQRYSNEQLVYINLIKQLENHLKEHGTPIQEV